MRPLSLGRLRIVHLEDDPRDCELVAKRLAADGLDCEIIRARTKSELQAALAGPNVDLILCDFVLPSYNGTEALETIKKLHPELPFIFVSGAIGEERAVESLRSGATDYVHKDNLDRLAPVVHRALREAVNRRDRKRAEEALHHSEDRLTQLIGAAQDAIIMMDAQGRISLWNKAAQRILGYSAEEALGQNLHSLLVPTRFHAAHERGFAEFQKAGTGAAVGQVVELAARHKAGIEFPIELSLAPIPLGGAWHAVGVLRDISERKRAEAALREMNQQLERRVTERTRELTQSEANLRAFFDTIDYFCFILDLQGNILQANQTVVSRLGYTEEELAGMPVINLHPPDRRAEAGGIVMAMVAGTRSFCPVPLQAKDGTLVPVETRVVAGTWRGQPALFGVSKDISELRSSEEKFSAIFRNNPSPMALTSIPDGRYLDVNAAFERVTGYTRTDVVGSSPVELGLFADLNQGASMLRLMTDRESFTGQEWRVRTKDGSLRHGLFSGDILRLQTGSLWLTVMVDITEARRIAEELRQAKDAAESANRTKSVFLANMSHEIRTPMNAILGFAQLMQRDPALTEQQRQWLQTINRSGEHLIHLISDILDMAKIESGRVLLAQEQFDFPSLLEAMEAMFRLRVEEKGLYLKLQQAADIPRHLFSDVGKIRQVLANLLGNAVKFTKQGGIRLRVTAEPAPPTASGQPAVRLCLEVGDTGPGILPEDLDRVFEAFEQARNQGSPSGGTGLGLAISRRLAQMLGGELTATSQAGVGSTFRFTFVAAVQVAASGAATSEARARRVIGLRAEGPPPMVLVVDDTQSNRAVLRDLLEMVGFVVREADDGATAAALCQAERPALVLMDRWMPMLDGLAATRMIRDRPGGRDVRILIVSADTIGTSEEVWQSAGADGFISKPFRSEELLTKIGTLLDLNYVYAEPSVPPAPARPILELSAIAQLPAGLRANIIRATEAGDGARLRDLIAQGVSPSQPALGQALGQLAAEYEYHTLLRALKKEEL